MWLIDQQGVAFPGATEALKQLRERSLQAIRAGDEQGRDVRQMVARLRDEAGHVLFEGTLDEASRLHVDGQIYVAPR